jgi:hypothetical protein
MLWHLAADSVQMAEPLYLLDVLRTAQCFPAQLELPGEEYVFLFPVSPAVPVGSYHAHVALVVLIMTTIAESHSVLQWFSHSNHNCHTLILL